MMKVRLTLLVLLQAAVMCCFAQNVGIGTTNPQNKLQVHGSLLVNIPTSATTTPPTAAQTKTMPGLGALAFLLISDSTGRLYDSGGPSGNYGIDQDGKATIASSGICIAIEVTAETMDLNTGDSLIIKESSTGATLLAVGNGYNTTGKWLFNSSSLYINFKSNNDFNTGTGFSLLFRRLYNNSSSLPDVSGAAGNSFFFDAKNGALRSGIVSNAPLGIYSTAAGSRTTASGDFSVAMGLSTIASGSSSIAMGQNTSAIGFSSMAIGLSTSSSGSYSLAMGGSTTANGYGSTAMGQNTTASGDISTAMGSNNIASGFASTAMGSYTIASGDYSTVMGNRVSSNNQEGSFLIGDKSTSTVMNSPAANNFRARFANGYRLYTSADYSTSCSLGAGGNAWTTSSDVHSKENFEVVDGESFLKKIAVFKLTSWNYKKQDSKTFRHYGPMAQDFFAAFGKDEYGTIGNDTTINSADFAGVSFIAIQALEKRTQEIEALKKDNEEVKKMLLVLQKENTNIKEQLQKLSKQFK